MTIVNILEMFPQDVNLSLVEGLHVPGDCQLVSVGSLSLMSPQSHHILGTFDGIVGAEQDRHEDVGEVPHVEDVVELVGSWYED